MWRYVDWLAAQTTLFTLEKSGAPNPCTLVKQKHDIGNPSHHVIYQHSSSPIIMVRESRVLPDERAGFEKIMHDL